MLGSDHLDALIGRLDEDEEGSVSHVLLEEYSFSPFSVLRVKMGNAYSLRDDCSSMSLRPGSASNREISPEDPLPHVPSPHLFTIGLAPSMSMVMPEGRTAAFLFHHYITHIAPLMMPFEDAQNPWKCSYPAVALEYESKEQICLYRGMQAQAAFNLAQLRCDSDNMQVLGTNRYASAMEQLRGSIAEDSRDYSTFLAATITLMMVEVNVNSYTTLGKLMGFLGLQWQVKTMENPPASSLELL